MKSTLALAFSGLLAASCQPAASQEETTAPTMNDYDPGEGYTLVWSDEFDGEALNKENWSHQVLGAGHFNDEWQRYTSSSENSFVEDGKLVIRATHTSESHGHNMYASARLHTGGKQEWTYGKFVAKLKLPQGNGTWPAFWMLGANIDEIGGDTPWPQSGEIDIMEFYGSKDNGAVEANVHFADSMDSHAMMGAETFRLDTGIFADDFHLFGLEWTPENLIFSVDDQEYARMDITGPEFTEFHKPFYLLLNFAVGGRHAGRPDSTTVFPQEYRAEWVRVYQKQ